MKKIKGIIRRKEYNDIEFMVRKNWIIGDWEFKKARISRLAWRNK